MRDKRLEPCKVCGRHSEIIQPIKGVWNVSCGDSMEDACGSVLYGGKETKAEMIQKWNDLNDLSDPAAKSGLKGGA